MKTKVGLVSAFAALCIGGMAFAELPPEEAYVGGVRLGYTEDQVTQIYGAPTSVSPASYKAALNGYAKSVKYGDSVSFYCASDTETGPFHVNSIHITANNGFTTPRGIHVGSTMQEVYRAYGKPDFDIPSKASPYIMYKTRNGKLVFHHKNGIVTRIAIGWE